MKKLNYFLGIAVLIAGLSTFTSCSDDDDNKKPVIEEPTGIENGSTIRGEITEDLLLEAGNSYKLAGGVHVKEGATLTIQEGVKITAVQEGAQSYLMIEQGAKIMAEGTSTNPIVFTSETKSAGSWGGIIINGKAPINKGESASSETGDKPYGGNDANDNSGVLKYIRAEYTGYQITTEKEHNGFTFNGVGAGTTVEYLQVYMGKDDGYEFFGGTVNAKYLVSTGSHDDSFDWTYGWTGKGQFWIAEQASGDNYSADNGMECDNNSKAFTATPVSNPTLSNITLKGIGGKAGLKLRAGTSAHIYNSIISNFAEAAIIETEETMNALNNGDLVVANSIFTNCGNFVYRDAEKNPLAPNAPIEAQSNIQIGGFALDGYIGTANKTNNVDAKDMSTIDSWFTSTNYIGAVKEGQDWTEGWTLSLDGSQKYSDKGVEPANATLTGNITENTVLKAGKTYKLEGGAYVKTGVTLFIEPGVTVDAVDVNISGTQAYLLIEQGAKIVAEGTKEDPIVFTSKIQERGSWGGIHICGYAKINKGGGSASSEIGDKPYGGNDNTDNSGVLKYVRLEYTGYQISTEKEHNGFSFYGVGNGTVVDHCEVYKGSDDGFEFFGGSVNAKYLISNGCGDDSFDWTYGWRGKAQFLIAIHDTDDGDRGMECDNNSKGNDLVPFSEPTISNVTLIGNGGTTSSAGLKLREGTKGKIYNVVVKNFPVGVDVDHQQTLNNIADGSLVFDYAVIADDCPTPFKYDTTPTTNEFSASSNVYNEAFSFTNLYYGTKNGGKDMSSDSFFTSTNFIGGVDSSNDWTEGWSKTYTLNTQQ